MNIDQNKLSAGNLPNYRHTLTTIAILSNTGAYILYLKYILPRIPSSNGVKPTGVSLAIKLSTMISCLEIRRKYQFISLVF
jgi:hypothetical protein